MSLFEDKLPQEQKKQQDGCMAGEENDLITVYQNLKLGLIDY